MNEHLTSYVEIKSCACACACACECECVGVGGGLVGVEALRYLTFLISATIDFLSICLSRMSF